MNPALHHQIFDRLIDDATLDDPVRELVDAACHGADELASALSEARGVEGRSGTARRSQPPAPARVYLKQIELGGLRGIGPAVKLELHPGPGLTLIVGRNGSGKSSIAEALETLLTGDSRRWSSRPKDWRQGWRNLHAKDGAFVEGSFYVEGGVEPIVVRRRWNADGELAEGQVRVRRGGALLAGGIGDLGWSEPLVTFRPFLAYSDLGTLLGDPSGLFDELRRILGLEEITAAIKRLAAARKERDDRAQQAKKAALSLVEELAALDDPRAVACREALAPRKWELDAIEAVVLGDDGSEANQGVGVLRQLSQLQGPSLEAIAGAVAGVRQALAARAGAASSAEDESARLAALLEQALGIVAAAAPSTTPITAPTTAPITAPTTAPGTPEGGGERHPSPHGAGDGAPQCPVCEASLPGDWAARAGARLEAAKARAAQARERAAELERRVAALRALLTPPPPALRQAAALGLPDAACEAWQRLAAAGASEASSQASSAELEPLCSGVESSALDLSIALEKLREAADARSKALASAWRPVARRLAEWLALARAVLAEADTLRALKRAEKWLKDAEASIRADRFKPIADRCQRIWTLLRQESSVDLAGIQLESSGTRRKVALDVSVDGERGVALGVMSQGELSALALALFLPRMTLDESPFHFLIIDDPVQAMDPHKVDGLAHVLDEVGKRRQVIVLTHDPRLAEAIRRLSIPANIVEVSRRAHSVVELRPAMTPVERHFNDARQCLYHEKEIGPGMAARTVPAFCRLALEAACTETIRRRRLARGEPHADVEDLLAETDGIHPLAALAIYDDPRLTERVYPYLHNKHGAWAADTFRAIKDGAHGHYDPSSSFHLRDLVANAERLARTLRALPNTPVSPPSNR